MNYITQVAEKVECFFSKFEDLPQLIPNLQSSADWLYKGAS